VTRSKFEDALQQHGEFVRFFREHSDWLFNYLHSLLRDLADAEDALQETSRVCWQKFDQYDRRMDFRGWACGIAYIEAMKIHKQRRKDGLLCSEKFLETISHRAVTMANQLDERSVALEGCLKLLPEKDRTLIDQRYTFGISVQELAEGVGRSVHAIYRALRRIHEMLQHCINRSLAE